MGPPSSGGVAILQMLGAVFSGTYRTDASEKHGVLSDFYAPALQPGTINVFFQRWLSRLPVPLGAADQHAGYWWELSMAQV